VYGEKLHMLYNLIMLNDIKDFLKAGQHTLSVAESVTSGHLQAAFSAAKEAALFFQGGITTYNIGQKARHLKIEPIYAEKCNCISQTVSDQMALECQKLFSSNYSIGITGYASPLPEMNIFELFAFYSISFNGTIKASGRIISEKKDPVNVQVDYSNQVIEAFFKLLHNKK
jgi:nicotinamide-nucleotide amidase